MASTRDLLMIHSCNAPYNLDDGTIDPTFPDNMGFDDEAMPESDAMMSALIELVRVPRLLPIWCF